MAWAHEFRGGQPLVGVGAARKLQQLANLFAADFHFARPVCGLLVFVPSKRLLHQWPHSLDLTSTGLT
jgi:hypothetical protein